MDSDSERYAKFEARIEKLDAFAAANFSDLGDLELSKLFRDWSWLKRPGNDEERAQAYLEDALSADSVSLGAIIEMFIEAWESKRGKVDYYHDLSDHLLCERVAANLDIQHLWYIMEDLFDLITEKITKQRAMTKEGV